MGSAILYIQALFTCQGKALVTDSLYEKTDLLLVVFMIY